MLTPQEITGKQFVKAVFGGYDMAVVDDFLETLTEDYTALYKENAILKSKIKVLVEKVEEYRSTEDAMRMALLTAQKMGDDIVADAKTKSEELLRETTEKSELAMQEAQKALEQEEIRLRAAKEATAAFVRENRALLSKLDQFLEAVPGLEIAVNEPEPEAPTAEEIREEEIMDAVHDIDDAVAKIAEEDIPEEVPEEVTVEEVIEEISPATYDDEGEFTSRPKFDFDNLRFGTNFSDEA